MEREGGEVEKDSGEGEWGHLRARGRAPAAPGALLEGGIEPDGDDGWVQHLKLRGVHDLDGWGVSQVLHGLCGAGRRARDHYRAGPRRERGVASYADGVPREPRSAVRVLHAGHDHG